jgi:hypothetical protein
MRPRKLRGTTARIFRAKKFVRSFSRAKGFGALSVELDAIDPNQLRILVDEAIERHLPPHEYLVLMAAEESERQAIKAFVVGGGDDRF